MNKEGFISTTENITPKEAQQAPYLKRTAFLKEAIAEGSLDKLPSKSITVDQWNRIVDIGLLYCLNDDLTQQDLATLYGLRSRERIRQLKNKFLINLWGNCSQELKVKYPLATIPMEKPRSQKFRERDSELNGGRSLRIKKAIGQGIKSVDGIAKVAGVTRQQILASIPVLNSWGIDTSAIR